MRKWLIALAAVLLAGCSAALPTAQETIIDWVDFVKWNDTVYAANYDGNEQNGQWQPAELLGKVTFKLDGNAGTNHQTKTGDASYLEKGTKIYSIEGYDPAFRILADGRMFEVSEPADAELLGDFLAIKGKVKRVILQSEKDGSFAGEFSEENTDLFIDELLSLPYEEDYSKMEGTRVFFAVELLDGSMTSSLYWLDTGYLTYGATVSEQMKDIFEKEMAANGF